MNLFYVPFYTLGLHIERVALFSYYVHNPPINGWACLSLSRWSNNYVPIRYFCLWVPSRAKRAYQLEKRTTLACQTSAREVFHEQRNNGPEGWLEAKPDTSISSLGRQKGLREPGAELEPKPHIDEK